jgi:hypothetical protein
MTWILISNCYLSQGALFHYLCKNITVTRDAHGKTWISDPRPGAPRLKHGDWTWIRSGYFLRWAMDSDREPEVRLIRFGASISLKERLQQIPSSSISNSVVLDPYSLLAIILEELSLQMDSTVWDVLDDFRHNELVFWTPTLVHLDCADIGRTP